MKSFSTSPTWSRRNMPPNAVPSTAAPPAPVRKVSTAVATSASRPRKCTRPRRESLRNRSSSSKAQVAPSRKISGSSNWKSALGMIIVRSQLGSGELRSELRDGGIHQVGQRLRIETEEQRACSERTQHQGLARVDVLQCLDVVVRDCAEDHPLHHPQRVAGADDEGQRG